MKQIKKIASFLLTLAMVLFVSVTAFAEPDTHTYELYQIFTGDYSDGILSNVKWGKNGTRTEGTAVDESVLDELKAVTGNTSDAAKLEVIKRYANLTSTPVNATPTLSDDGKVTYNNLAKGYYLVKDKEGSVTGNDVYTTYVVEVTNGTLTFTRKGDVPTVDKKIVEEDNSKVNTNEASIGDTVNFEITGTLPTNFGDYKEYTYLLTDTLSKGLTYTHDSIKVYAVNGSDKTEVTGYFYKNAGPSDATKGTTLKVGIADLKALRNLTPAVTVNKDTKIVVRYSAVLNENAVIAGGGNENTVKLNYSNDPNNSGSGTTAPPPENPGEPTTPDGETPDSRTVTYTTELTILKKKNSVDGEILTGAEFTLTGNGVNVVLVTADTFTEDANGEYWKLKDGTYTTTAPVTTGGDDDNSNSYDSTTTKYTKTTTVTVKGTGKTETNVVGAVDSSGHVTFSGLGAGTYTITETKTPAGYNTIAPISFTLTFNADTKTFISSNTAIVVGNDNMLDTTIVNKSGSSLPSTGGMGTTIFYILGTILVVGAGVLLIVRRRVNREK